MFTASRVLGNIDQTPEWDDAITSYEFISHPPITDGTSNSDEIRIPIAIESGYIHPGNSHLRIEGRIIRPVVTFRAPSPTGSGEITEQRDDSNSRIGFNGPAFMFDSIHLELNGEEIDAVKGLGTATTLKNLISIPSSGENHAASWGFAEQSEDDFPTIPNEHDGEDRRFSFSVPLARWMGFFEDFHKILVNPRLELILNRSKNDVNALYATRPEDKSSIAIDKIEWCMPHVKVNEEEEVRLLKLMQRDASLPIAFRSWEMHTHPHMPPHSMDFLWRIKTTKSLETPRFFIIAFQHDKLGAIERKPEIFDHIDVTNIRVFLNDKAYPIEAQKLDFERNRVSSAVEAITAFQPKYYYPYGQMSGPMIGIVNFVTKFPVFVIDCSAQPENLMKNVDVRIEIETKKPIPERTTCHMLILHDRVILYQPISSDITKVDE
jgi:hypothetical protein